MPDFRTAIVVDYQNVHLTGHGRFKSTRYGPKHEALIDPLHFSNQLLQVRNSRQRDGRPNAVLRTVDVYRGLPNGDHDPDGYARNLAQKAQWERDNRVTVTHRPLRYRYMRDGTGRPVRDPVTEIKIPEGPPTEKGVDVMCALALLRHARRPDIDLVILASLDSDLIPALDEVVALGERVETFSWWSPDDWSFEMHLSDRSRRIWNTRLGEQEFLRCIDRTDYT
jgi:uncharacterized LabA/DUF88 family protein